MRLVSACASPITTTRPLPWRRAKPWLRPVAETFCAWSGGSSFSARSESARSRVLWRGPRSDWPEKVSTTSIRSLALRPRRIGMVAQAALIASKGDRLAVGQVGQGEVRIDREAIAQVDAEGIGESLRGRADRIVVGDQEERAAGRHPTFDGGAFLGRKGGPAALRKRRLAPRAARVDHDEHLGLGERGAGKRLADRLQPVAVVFANLGEGPVAGREGMDVVVPLVEQDPRVSETMGGFAQRRHLGELRVLGRKRRGEQGESEE